MSKLVNGLDPASLLNQALPKIQSKATQSPEALDRAAKEFEGLFLNELFKVMRKTVPDDSGKGFASKLFTGMLDSEIAKSTAGNTGLGLSGMIRNQLMGTLGRATATSGLLMDGGWVQPVAGEIGELRQGQRFGAQRHGLRPEECGDGHCGIDLARKTGTPVGAARDGVVTRIGRDPNSKAGLWVEVAHAGGRLNTRYLHLDSIREGLMPGDILRGGEHLGRVGNTGSSSHGAHLHFEVYETTPEGGRKYWDPNTILRSAGPPGEGGHLEKDPSSKLFSKVSGVSGDGKDARGSASHHFPHRGIKVALAERYKLGEPSGGRR